MKKQFAALLTALSLLPTRLRWRSITTPAGDQEQAKDGGTKPTPTNTGGKRL